MKKYTITYMDMRSHEVTKNHEIKCFDIINWIKTFAVRGFQILEYKHHN